jgi:hypothetical protein
MKTIIVIVLALMLIYCGVQIFGKPAHPQVYQETPQVAQEAPKPQEPQYVMAITEEVIEEVEE